MAIPSQKARGVSCQSATPQTGSPTRTRTSFRSGRGKLGSLGRESFRTPLAQVVPDRVRRRVGIVRGRHELEELGQHIDRRHVGHGRHDVLGDLVDVRHVGDDRGPSQ